jgi:hypothetical protein
MFGTRSGYSPGHDFAAIRYKASQLAIILVVDHLIAVDAEPADFSAPPVLSCHIPAPFADR